MIIFMKVPKEIKFLKSVICLTTNKRSGILFCNKIVLMAKEREEIQ